MRQSCSDSQRDAPSIETYSYPASLYPPVTIASAIDLTSFSEMQLSLRDSTGAPQLALELEWRG